MAVLFEEACLIPIFRALSLRRVARFLRSARASRRCCWSHTAGPKRGWPTQSGLAEQRWVWSQAVEIRAQGGTVIVAGGLTPGNVAEAIAAARPDAVDVSGGVESKPGVKDPAKLKAFFDAVR